MHQRGDNHDRPGCENRHDREPEEPIFTTLAIGEEGDPDPYPDPVVSPDDPVFTTLAVGEEGGGGEPEWPSFTTLAIGEEGDPGTDPWGA